MLRKLVLLKNAIQTYRSPAERSNATVERHIDIVQKHWGIETSTQAYTRVKNTYLSSRDKQSIVKYFTISTEPPLQYLARFVQCFPPEALDELALLAVQYHQTQLCVNLLLKKEYRQHIKSAHIEGVFLFLLRADQILLPTHNSLLLKRLGYEKIGTHARTHLRLAFALLERPKLFVHLSSKCASDLLHAHQDRGLNDAFLQLFFAQHDELLAVLKQESIHPKWASFTLDWIVFNIPSIRKAIEQQPDWLLIARQLDTKAFPAPVVTPLPITPLLKQLTLEMKPLHIEASGAHDIAQSDEAMTHSFAPSKQEEIHDQAPIHRDLITQMNECLDPNISTKKKSVHL